MEWSQWVLTTPYLGNVGTPRLTVDRVKRRGLRQAVEGQFIQFHSELENLFNWGDFANPAGALANALGSLANQVHQPFSASTSGNSTFGVNNRTAGLGIGLGINC